MIGKGPHLVTSGTSWLESLSVVAATVQLAVPEEVDEVHKQLVTQCTREARGVPHAPSQLCHAPARARTGHPDGAGAPRTPEPQHDDDLHARVESRWPWCCEPTRQALIGENTRP